MHNLSGRFFLARVVSSPTLCVCVCVCVCVCARVCVRVYRCERAFDLVVISSSAKKAHQKAENTRFMAKLIFLANDGIKFFKSSQ